MDAGREVQWALARNPASSRLTDRTGEIFDAIEAIRVPGARWPLFAWYGTDRLRSPRRPARSALDIRDRRAGYASSLDPTVNETLLLDTLLAWGIAGFPIRPTAVKRDSPFSNAVCAAMARAAPGVTKIWPGHPGMGGPVVWFENGQVTPWAELSDGYHVFLALIGDIARRAVLLNETDGLEAPERIEGVVLIDEIDLHLHPRWQRVVIDGLRNAFPRLQFVLTTHSPQVLSSVENRQVRRLAGWGLAEQDVLVEGRDSNAILRELMNTDDRDDAGVVALRELYNAIDSGRRDDAARIYRDLHGRWGDLDPELIRAQGLMMEQD